MIFFRDKSKQNKSIPRAQRYNFDVTTARALTDDPMYLSDLADSLKSGTLKRGTAYQVLWLLVMDRYYKQSKMMD